MIEFCAGGTKIRLDFSFFAVITLFLCFDKSGYGLMSLAACFFHECGHLVAMTLCGKTPASISFYGGGIRLSGSVYDLSVMIAGSAANFLIAAAVFIFSDGSSIYPLIFAMVNVVIGLFNLLPIGYLDGKNILEHFIIKKLSPQKAVVIMQFIEATAAFLVFFSVVLLFFLQLINFTVAIMLIYLILLDIFSKM